MHRVIIIGIVYYRPTHVIIAVAFRAKGDNKGLFQFVGSTLAAILRTSDDRNNVRFAVAQAIFFLTPKTDA